MTVESSAAARATELAARISRDRGPTPGVSHHRAMALLIARAGLRTNWFDDPARHEDTAEAAWSLSPKQ